MGNMDVRAKVKELPSGLFRLEVIVIRATSGMPEHSTHEEERTFFSRSEARAYARNHLGLPDSHIW